MPRHLIVSTIVAFAATTAPAQDPVVKEWAGEYTVKVFERGGKAVPDEARKTISAAAITDGKLTLTAGGKSVVAVLRAFPTRTPPELDLFPQGDEFVKGRRFLGLYQYDKGVLTLVFAEDGDRPADLKGDSPNVTKLVLVKK